MIPLILAVLLGLAGTFALYFFMKKRHEHSVRRGRRGKEKAKSSENISETLFSADKKDRDYFSADRKNVLDLISPNGVNPNPMSYFVLDDAGIPVYYCGLYIDKLPRRSDMGVQFAPLFNYPNVTSTVFIDPMQEESIQAVNKRINMLDSELYGAEKSDNSRNRIRELDGKMADAEAWGRKLDSGENTLFRVGFLFLLRADSLEHLRIAVSDFEGAARKKQIELLSCYGAHMEAFLSSLPLNRIFPVTFCDKAGAFSQKLIKMHVMDKLSLSTIYNHTTSAFTHRDGVPLGRNLFTGVPVCFDPFDPVHTSYGIVVAGMPGYGKSGTLKSLFSRLIDFDYHVALIDYEPLPAGKCGEYTPLVEHCGGISYTICNDGACRLNLYELNEELDYDRNADVEYRTLRVNDKVVELTNILLAIATSITVVRRESSFRAEILARMSSIITKVVRDLFEERGIVDGDADSLYESGLQEDALEFSSGLRRKALPTQHDFYMKLVRYATLNRDSFKNEAYSLLLDVFEDTVAELYYDPITLFEYSREEFYSVPVNERGERMVVEPDGRTTALCEVHGMRAYFDGQSNVRLDQNAPCVSFDVSQVSETERPILMLVCQNFIEENFVKLNSANPRRAKRLLFLEDEAHKVLPYEGARAYLNSCYRTARKRHVGPILAMQSIADLSRYQDTEDILKNTETFLLFKHSYSDRDYIKKVTNLTDSQVDMILNLGGDQQSDKKRPGECCIIEVPTKRSVFVHADYLKDSEQKVVETDPEIIASMYAGRRGNGN